MCITVNNPNHNNRNTEHKQLVDQLFLLIESIPVEKLDMIAADVIFHMRDDTYDLKGVWHSSSIPQEIVFEITSWTNPNFNTDGKLYIKYDKNFEHLINVHFQI
jgi:hypothetical protein